MLCFKKDLNKEYSWFTHNLAGEEKIFIKFYEKLQNEIEIKEK